MAKFKKSILINAPVEKIFAFVEDPRHLPDIWPSLVEVHDVKPSPKGGFDYGWTYKMAGSRFAGASEVVEYVQNQRLTTNSTQGIQNRIAWSFTSEDGGTRFTSEVEYTVPVPLLGRLAEAVILKQNEQETDMVCHNLKIRMEAEVEKTSVQQ